MDAAQQVIKDRWIGESSKVRFRIITVEFAENLSGEVRSKIELLAHLKMFDIWSLMMATISVTDIFEYG